MRDVFLAWDHAGEALGTPLWHHLQSKGWPCSTYGAANQDDKIDYPKVIPLMVQKVRAGHWGVLVCGTGIGMSIAANRHPGIRGALCHDVTTAALSRRHNDANVLVLGARVTGLAVALGCLEAFLTTPFEAGRHQARLNMIDQDF